MNLIDMKLNALASPRCRLDPVDPYKSKQEIFVVLIRLVLATRGRHQTRKER